MVMKVASSEHRRPGVGVRKSVAVEPVCVPKLSFRLRKETGPIDRDYPASLCHNLKLMGQHLRFLQR